MMTSYGSPGLKLTLEEMFNLLKFNIEWFALEFVKDQVHSSRFPILYSKWEKMA